MRLLTVCLMLFSLVMTASGINAQPQDVIDCFVERSFPYTGGRYQNAEIKYRLCTPKTIRYGRKYPLIIFLHGFGEAGSDNTSSLMHLQTILPILTETKWRVFYMLVVQSPLEMPHWDFSSAKDGSLDLVAAAMEHVVANNPIDQRRISVTGVSSGGWGVWILLSKYPDTFAGAVPTATSAPSHIQGLSALKNTQIWSITNKGDKGADPQSNRTAMQMINNSGGSMAFTEADATAFMGSDPTGHNAWPPAMINYNCFQWMLAQKRGSWFSPPPGTVVHNTSKSFLSILVMFVLPLTIIVFLSWRTIYEQATNVWQTLRERLYKN